MLEKKSLVGIGISMCLFWAGCDSHLHGHRACFVAAPKRGIFVDKNKMNLLLLVETLDDLYAEVVTCGDKEFLLAGMKLSAKSLLAGPDTVDKVIKKPRVKPKLSCTDALTMYPPTEEKTFELLDSLCRIAERDFPGYTW